MDSQSADLAGAEKENDELIGSEGDDEAGPQVKKKRTSKPKRNSSSMKSASICDGRGALETVPEEGEAEAEGEEKEERGNSAVVMTERVKERLFAALCRDMLKLGECKGSDKVLVKEYVKLCSSVCDCGWLTAENVRLLRSMSFGLIT